MTIHAFPTAKRIRPVGYESERPQRKCIVENDYCSQSGAQKIADAVASYWFLRGYEVAAETKHGDTAQLDDHHARTDVRSDMVNGLPPGCVWRNGKAVRK